MRLTDCQAEREPDRSGAPNQYSDIYEAGPPADQADPASGGKGAASGYQSLVVAYLNVPPTQPRLM